MGLAIVKKLVESAGGKIWIADNQEPRGTRFQFTWPSASA
jgi:signal transduction histidine kinase